MRLLGFELSIRRRAAPANSQLIGDRGNWWVPVVREPYTGAWQRNDSQTVDSMLTMYAVYACIERIASDVGKCRIKLVEKDDDGIWNETESAAFAPVLRKPNHFQTRIQFYEFWIMSKLTAGNTFILKERDARGVVVALYVLDPRSVRILVTPLGDVYYELNTDNLAGLTGDKTVTVPASEIIQDMMTIKFHPLIGISPLIAVQAAASQSNNIQKSSSIFFQNNATPGGVLTAPGEIKEATAKRLKEYWQTEFGGNNAGKIAVLGDGLKFEPMTATAEQSQVAEQLGLTAQMVCSAFGVPAYMVGVGNTPTYNNINALNQQYYSQCLQKYFEAIELLLDEGLGLVETPNRWLGTEFDLDDLLRMDTMSMMESIDKGVKAGVMKPNEGRKKLNYGPVEGGDAAYLQQQNFSLEALAKRDAQDNPFGPGGGAKPPTPAAPPAPPAPAEDEEEEEEQASMADLMRAQAWLRMSIENRAAS